VEEGNSVDFCLKGTGTYEEHLEKRNWNHLYINLNYGIYE